MATVRLLRHEQDRMTLQRERVLAARAEVTADHIRLAIRDVEEELLAELRRLDAPNPVPNLLDWQRRHPLIRNVYVWSPKTGLIHPATDATATEAIWLGSGISARARRITSTTVPQSSSAR